MAGGNPTAAMRSTDTPFSGTFGASGIASSFTVSFN
eukprot:CAMPEP_0172416508 /NCGR_PEP_ID=MMETSP1064-20121228/3001_1 /TAXON_ID=202472 /ORGANISM="Aulacoseira subarctica , Strain CCAP 1002/5" /LENGTH=35 /DNA_ID= /DNA_START= /DNA_END= /DNA_ORIENTATION=